MKNMKKILVLALAALLLVAVSVAGTVAYLTATTDPVTNTFAPADIDLELKETLQSDGTTLGSADWKGQFVPGVELKKNPVVTVTNDVDCYVFLKVTEQNWDSTIATYTIDTSVWTQLPNTTDVWYKEVPASTSSTVLNVITNQKITVSENVQNMETLYTTNSNGTKVAKEIKLTFTAYACQKANGASSFEPADAWAKVDPTPTNP